jgi:hypothetical protein
MYELAPGQVVIVPADRGYNIGVILHLCQPSGEEWGAAEQIISVIPSHDSNRQSMIVEKVMSEKNAMEFCLQKSRDLFLDGSIFIISVEFQFDRKKLTVYYKKSEDVSLCKFIRKLYNAFKMRIWMELVDSSADVDHYRSITRRYLNLVGLSFPVEAIFPEHGEYVAPESSPLQGNATTSGYRVNPYQSNSRGFNSKSSFFGADDPSAQLYRNLRQQGDARLNVLGPLTPCVHNNHTLSSASRSNYNPYVSGPRGPMSSQDYLKYAPLSHPSTASAPTNARSFLQQAAYNASQQQQYPSGQYDHYGHSAPRVYAPIRPLPPPLPVNRMQRAVPPPLPPQSHHLVDSVHAAPFVPNQPRYSQNMAPLSYERQSTDAPASPDYGLDSLLWGGAKFPALSLNLVTPESPFCLEQPVDANRGLTDDEDEIDFSAYLQSYV